MGWGEQTTILGNEEKLNFFIQSRQEPKFSLYVPLSKLLVCRHIYIWLVPVTQVYSSDADTAPTLSETDGIVGVSPDRAEFHTTYLKQNVGIPEEDAGTTPQTLVFCSVVSHSASI